MRAAGGRRRLRYIQGMAIERMDLCRRALSEARARGMSRVQLSIEGVRLQAVLGDPPEDEAPDVLAPAEPKRVQATSPVVGWFRPLDPPIEAGAKVAKGDLLGHVFALEFLNDVAAPMAGVVEEVLVQADDAVDFGRPLFSLVEEAAG